MTLEKLFEKTGFIITNSCCYEGDQYLLIEALIQPEFYNNSLPRIVSDDSETPLPAVIGQFSDHFEQRVDYWNKRLNQANRDNKSVVLWGSAGKGISFLNPVTASNATIAVVDINPNRQHSYIPGTRHPVVAPEWLVQHPPGLVVITNPIYESEIHEQLAALNIVTEFDCI